MRLVDLTSPLGLAAIAGAWIADLRGAHVPGGPGVWTAVGAALILAHILLRWEDIVRTVGGRQIRYGSNALVLGAVVLAILGFANYLVNRHTKRWDLTKSRRYSLSEQTQKVVEGLKEDVTLTYFQNAEQLAAARERLKEYEALSPHVKTQFVDPFKEPAKAREYDISVVPTIVLQRGAKREKITRDSEQDVTNALVKVTRNGDRAVCFLEGEGERDPEDTADTGFSLLKTGLTSSGYSVSKTSLKDGKVPAECTVLIVAGPQKDLMPGSIETLKTFVNAGGRVIVMIEPEFKDSFPNLTHLLADWDIEAGNDLVVDASIQSQLAGAGFETPLTSRYPSHEITRNFHIKTVYHEARSVQAGKTPGQGVSAQNLVETSEASWAQKDLKTIHEQGPQKDDRMGPIGLAAVATVRATQAAPSPAPSGAPDKPPAEGRVIAFGDADFASNKLLGLPVGNKDLILNSVAWLSQDTDLIAIRPKDVEDQRLFLTGSQVWSVLLFSLLVLPGVFAVLGVMSWWSRR